MNITDVVTLAKAGYKVNEIKELMELEPQPKQEEEIKKEDPEKENENKIDFQSILDEKDAEIKRLQAEIENNKQALEQAQKTNKTINISGEGTDDMKVLSDYVKAFM